MKKSVLALVIFASLSVCACSSKNKQTTSNTSSISSIDPNVGEKIEKEEFFSKLDEIVGTKAYFSTSSSLSIEGEKKKSALKSTSYSFTSSQEGLVKFSKAAINSVTENNVSPLKESLESGKVLLTNQYIYGSETTNSTSEIYLKDSVIYEKGSKNDEISYYSGDVDGLLKTIQDLGFSFIKSTGYNIPLTEDDLVNLVLYAQENFFSYYKKEDALRVEIKLSYTTLRKFLESTISYYVKNHDDIDIPILNSQSGAVSAALYIANMITINIGNGEILIPMDGSEITSSLKFKGNVEYDETVTKEDGTTKEESRTLTIDLKYRGTSQFLNEGNITYPEDMSSWKQETE